MGKKNRHQVKAERKDFKNGSKHSLLGYHGQVDPDKALDAIKYRIKEDIIDIKMINEAGTTACLMLDRNGRAYDVIDAESEKFARYKIVPIGYYDRFTDEPLYASFMKTSFGWEGIFVGTAYQLVRRSIEFSFGSLTKDDHNYLSNFSTKFPLRGNGYKEILENLSKDIGNDIKQSKKEFNTIADTAIIDPKALEVFNKVLEGTEDKQEKELEVQEEEVEETTDLSVSAFKRRKNLYDDIYNRLLIKENWRISHKNRLGFYLKAIFEKVEYEQKNTSGNIGNGYILSNDRTKCLVNTGLMDVYNNDIYVIDKTNSEKDFHRKEIVIVSSKAALVDFGFNRQDIKVMPGPIKFYNDKSSLIFSGTIDEFDLEDDYRLNHIINERRSRFPEEYANVPSDIICDKIKSAIHKAIKISSRDYKYIVPMYNLKTNKIQYLMPLHLDRSIDEAPELTIVIGERNEFWCVYTILNTDDAYDNARLLCRPDNTWLSANKDIDKSKCDTVEDDEDCIDSIDRADEVVGYECTLEGNTGD